MLRSTTVRPFLKGLVKVNSTRSSYNAAASASKLGLNAQFHSLSTKRPTVATKITRRPVTISVLRYATGPTSDKPFDKIDKAAEEKLASQKIKAHPDLVSGGSSVRHVFEPSPAENEADMMGGIKADIVSLQSIL